MISWTLLVLFSLQHFPSIVSSIAIIFSKRRSGVTKVGPTIFGRVVLSLSLLFAIPNFIPLQYWFLFVRGTKVSTDCIMYIASFFDIFVLNSVVHHVLLFIFIRGEYKRNQEAAKFAAMQRTPVCTICFLLVTVFRC